MSCTKVEKLLRHRSLVQMPGVPLHDVAVLLGHTSIKTTEKHYATFVMARMEQLDEHVKAAWRI